MLVFDIIGFTHDSQSCSTFFLKSAKGAFAHMCVTSIDLASFCDFP